MKYTKKLIEVALPLDAINEASVREKAIRHGHPSTLHLWWARRPLATARAVIFAQMVDDPSEYVDALLLDPQKKREAERDLEKRLAKRAEQEPELNDEASEEPIPTLEEVIAEHERDRLFQIIKALVKWENTTNQTVLQWARDEIWRSWRRECAKHADHPQAAELFNPHKLPGFHDPFAGGGALPLEAQRLGLESFASDLNPVAVLINMAMIEIPAKFVGQPPVNPESRSNKHNVAIKSYGLQGLIEDIDYYGKWVRNEAKKRIDHLYPRVEITTEMITNRPDLEPLVGRKFTVIAWIWTRTVRSPNPAFSDIHVPLTSSFLLSRKEGNVAFVEPIIGNNNYSFSVRIGENINQNLRNGTKTSRGANFQCLMSKVPISSSYIKTEGKEGRIGTRLMAIVADGDRGRLYLPPTDNHSSLAKSILVSEKPTQTLPKNPRWFSPPAYGILTYADLFTDRQLMTLTVFSDLVTEAVEKIQGDIYASNLYPEKSVLRNSDIGALAYAKSIVIFLAFALSKQADLGNSLCRWEPNAQCPRNLFSRQALPMVWDYAEGNPLGNSSGSWSNLVNGITKALSNAFRMIDVIQSGHSQQYDAGTQKLSIDKVVSTDPPYYDNIGYSDLSDFFYVWLRRSLRAFYPDLFSTISVPKSEELVANPYRHGDVQKAERFFLNGMTEAIQSLANQAHPGFPITIYYAFKQAEQRTNSGATSTGWETFLDAIIRAGLTVTGTLPMRTENASRMVGQGTNALASSVVLVCRSASAKRPIITLRKFIIMLKNEVPTALKHLQHSSIAPVDLSQAAIGPGMAVYTRHSKVLDASGRAVSVRQALALINQTLDEVLADQGGDYDSDSRWAVAWFEEYGFVDGEYGVAETLSKAKNTSIAGLIEAGILVSNGGKVRLLKPREFPSDWDPEKDSRLTAWDAVHHLIRILEAEGEEAASDMLRKLGPKAETARELCYRLFTVCERKKRFTEAMSYNTLVKSWPEIALRAGAQPALRSEKMFGERS